MNTETIVGNPKESLNHELKGKSFKMGIPNIPESELETFEKASAYLHESFIMPDSDKRLQKENNNLDLVQGRNITKLPSKEQKKRILIRNKALDSLLKVSIDKVRYKDHLTQDPCGFRYTTRWMMHRTPVKEADLQYNQRITDLLTRAKNNEFSDKKVLDKQTQKDKEELLGHFRKMLKMVEEYDLDELLSKDWTDEELAEHAGEIYTLNSVLTYFQNVHDDLPKKFGINDSKCEKIIQTYDRYANYFQILNSKVSCITSFGYEIYEAKNEPDFKQRVEEDPHNPPDPLFTDSMDAYKNYYDGMSQYVGDAVKELFGRLGISTDDVSVINPDPDAENKGPEGIYTAGTVTSKDGEATFVCEKANIKLTFNVWNGELAKALAQNRFSELIEKTIVKDPASVEKPNEVAKPPKVGFLGKVADFFTNIVKGHKPRQDAYDKSMAEYNNYQSELKKYNNYITGHKAYLAVKDESKAKERIVTTLREKEAAIDEAFHKYKIDSDLEREALRFGFISQIDDSKLQIGNDAEVQNLIKKEMPGLGQLQNQEPKPEVAEKLHDKIIIEDEPILK